MEKSLIDLTIKDWNLDYRVPPYDDCTDGKFESERCFSKGDILNLDLQGLKRRVKVFISVQSGASWITYFDIED